MSLPCFKGKKGNSDYSVITSAIRITAKTHTVLVKLPMVVIKDSCLVSVGMVGDPWSESSYVCHLYLVLLTFCLLPLGHVYVLCCA